MTSAKTRRFEAQSGTGFPLLELHSFVRKQGAPDPDEVRDLARRLRLAPASVRGALTYYQDLADPDPAVRICRGTSCTLAGATRLAEAIAPETRERPIYCVGYCDRSPAVLREDGAVLLRCRPETVAARLREAPRHEPAPEIRCVAPEPIVTRRIGRGDFSGLARAREDGAYAALRNALTRAPEAVLAAVERSGERGRGGAGFPTGAKWRRCAGAPGRQKFVIANGDEGDPGSFIDRILLEHDPHAILEGMALCGYAVGASQGIAFIRSEYPEAITRIERAVAEAEAAGVLGPSVLGSEFAFHVTVFPGLGSYVCGEETAMLNAIEGIRGEVRLRPPYPAVEGLRGQPTVVNNVETLVNVPWIVDRGPEAYAALGTAASSGTKALCLSAGFANPGIVELEFGVSLRRVIEELAGGAGGRSPLEAVLLGGPMGSLLAPEEWDVPVCYGAMGEQDIRLGHGGLVAISSGTDLRGLLVHLLTFMADESCGKCVPCRLGSRRALGLARRAGGGTTPAGLDRLFEVMEEASLCAFGQLMPGPMRQLLERFGERMFAGETGP